MNKRCDCCGGKFVHYFEVDEKAYCISCYDVIKPILERAERAEGERADYKRAADVEAGERRRAYTQRVALRDENAMLKVRCEEHQIAAQEAEKKSDGLRTQLADMTKARDAQKEATDRTVAYYKDIVTEVVALRKLRAAVVEYDHASPVAAREYWRSVDEALIATLPKDDVNAEERERDDRCNELSETHTTIARHVATLEAICARITEIADDRLGLQVPGTPVSEMLDALDADAGRWRIRAVNLEVAAARLCRGNFPSSHNVTSPEYEAWQALSALVSDAPAVGGAETCPHGATAGQCLVVECAHSECPACSFHVHDPCPSVVHELAKPPAPPAPEPQDAKVGWDFIANGTPAPKPEAPGSAWRQGRKVGRTLYLNDALVGVMDTEALAASVVQAMSALSPTSVEPPASVWIAAPILGTTQWTGTGVRVSSEPPDLGSAWAVERYVLATTDATDEEQSYSTKQLEQFAREAYPPSRRKMAREILSLRGLLARSRAESAPKASGDAEATARGRIAGWNEALEKAADYVGVEELARAILAMRVSP